MAKIHNFWFKYRDRIARILFGPYVFSAVVYTLYGFYARYQELQFGFESPQQCIFWALTSVGTICFPTWAKRSWIAIFHDATSINTFMVDKPMRRIDPDTSTLVISLVLIGFALMNWLLPGSLLQLVDGIVYVAVLFALVVHLPFIGIYLVSYVRHECVKAKHRSL